MSKRAREGDLALGGAFTLIELMIIVTIIGLLAILAMPMVAKSRMRSQSTAFISDLRLCCHLMEQYTMQKGDYPPEALPGAVPAGMQDFLPSHFDWTADTPIGGRWDWDRAPYKGSTNLPWYAAMGVYRPERTAAQMVEVDLIIDDGNLATGAFRSKADGYVYILEQ